LDAEAKAHLFEPFYTTKETGKGTGLGLATVYGIIAQSGGEIEVDSEPGQGATFRIHLPRVLEAAETPAPRIERALSIRGTETILVVEDEEVVRSMIRQILERSGYQVLLARDGLEGIAALGSHEGTIHLLLTDLVMPRMGGRDLADHAAG